jgi:TonB family protein
MNKKLSGLLFGSMLLVYCSVITFSYTSCNSDSSDKTASTPATDTSNMTPAADTTKTAAKKVKKGKAMVLNSTMSNSKMAKDKEGVYTNPQTMPEYPGGQAALTAYVENHLNYPQAAIDDSKEGTVSLSFVIDENGNVVNPVVTGNKVGDGLDEQAVTVIKNMPKWKPGTVKGKNVKTRLDLPIKFQVQES